MLFHQHSTLLKHYGFKRLQKQTGPNHANPAKTSVLSSTWKHKKIGSIFINHSTHTFCYYPPPPNSLNDFNVPIQPIGKNNKLLKEFLEKLFVENTASDITVEFPKTFTEHKVAASGFSPEALNAQELSFKKMNDTLEALKQTALEAPKLSPLGAKGKIHGFPMSKEALDKFFNGPTGKIGFSPDVEVKKVESGYAFTPIIDTFKEVGDAIFETEPEIPAELKKWGLVAKYVHKKHSNITYSYELENKNFKSSQNKTFSPSTIKWMLGQDILAPVTDFVHAVESTEGIPANFSNELNEVAAQKSLPDIPLNSSGQWTADGFKPFLKELKEQQQVDFTDKFSFVGSGAQLGGAHSKYLFVAKDTGLKYLFKPAKTIAGTKASLLAYADKLASDIGSLLRPESYVPVYVGTINVPEIGKMFGSFQPMLSDVSCLSSYGPETLKTSFEGKLIPQVQQEHVIDWLISNHDAHNKHFLADKFGRLYGIDKTQAYKFFPDDELSKTYHPNKQETAPYYNGFFTASFQLDPSCIHDIILKAQAIPDDDFKQILAPYAAARFKNVEDANLFLHTACQRKKNLKKDFEKFYGTEIKPPFKPIVVKKDNKSLGPKEMIDVLLTQGYKFVSFGMKTKYPKYKDSDGKTVYLIGLDGWEYYPMGSSSMNPYGSTQGHGKDKLINALNQPFEKPEVSDIPIHGVTSAWTGEDADKFHALPELTLKSYAGYATGGDPVKHITVTGDFTHEEKGTIISYKGSGYVSINQFLYQGQEAHGGNYLADAVQHLNSALTKSKTNKNLILWRGLQGTYSDLVRKQLLSGDKIIQPNSFQSCSTSQNFSHNWSGSNAYSPKVVLRITLPAGSPAVAPNSVTPAYQSEKELILSHTVIFEVQGLYQHKGALYADVVVSQHKPATEQVIEQAIEEEAKEELVDVEKPVVEKIWIEPTQTKAGYFKKISVKKKKV